MFVHVQSLRDSGGRTRDSPFHHLPDSIATRHMIWGKGQPMTAPKYGRVGLYSHQGWEMFKDLAVLCAVMKWYVWHVPDSFPTGDRSKRAQLFMSLFCRQVALQTLGWDIRIYSPCNHYITCVTLLQKIRFFTHRARQRLRIRFDKFWRDQNGIRGRWERMSRMSRRRSAEYPRDLCSSSIQLFQTKLPTCFENWLLPTRSLRARRSLNPADSETWCDGNI